MWDEIKDLPYSMQEKALWARNKIVEHLDNSDIEMCPEGIIWVWNEEHETWWGINGRYTHVSPEVRKLQADEHTRCENEYNEELFKKNAEKIADIEYWSAIRQKVLKRDKNTCQDCKTKIKKLHIHHIVPRKQGGTDHDDNLVTLCASCHGRNEPNNVKKL